MKQVLFANAEDSRCTLSSQTLSSGEYTSDSAFKHVITSKLIVIIIITRLYAASPCAAKVRGFAAT